MLRNDKDRDDIPPPHRLTWRLLTVREVARILRVDRHTVGALLESGTMIGFKVGHHWRISESALNWFIERGGTRGVLR